MNVELNEEIKKLLKEVKELDASIAPLAKKKTPTVSEKQELIRLRIKRTGKANQLTILQRRAKVKLSNDTLAANSRLKKVGKIPIDKLGDGNALSTLQVPSKNLAYNVPSVQEAYFSSRVSFLDVARFSSNKPASIGAASDLWTSAKASKGMIVTHIHPGETQSFAAASFPPSAKPFFGKNYGFQFMYNPATVSMDYVSSPGVDMGLQTSGREKFNIVGTNKTMSTITFTLVINRMFDMKYYDSTGVLKANGAKAYGGRVPTGGEQKDIFNKGTMYDVEYLLRTLLGFTLKSFIRSGDTADIGYLGARPVELHLGKSLRYWGTVTSVGLNHVIFNENMVPLFTNVSISFSRLPDFPGAIGNS